MKVLLACPSSERGQLQAPFEAVHLLDLLFWCGEGLRVASVFWQRLFAGKASFVCLFNPIILAVPLRVPAWSLEGLRHVK